jgi:hypothetical protein
MFPEDLTKTGKVRRVPLDASTLGWLRNHRLVCEGIAQQAGVKLSKEAYVFSSSVDGLVFWRPDAVTRRFRTFRDAAGMDNVPLYSLRHQAATTMIDAGVDAKTASDQLGNSVATILSTYTRGRTEADVAAARRPQPRQDTGLWRGGQAGVDVRDGLFDLRGQIVGSDRRACGVPGDLAGKKHQLRPGGDGDLSVTIGVRETRGIQQFDRHDVAPGLAGITVASATLDRRPLSSRGQSFVAGAPGGSEVSSRLTTLSFCKVAASITPHTLLGRMYQYLSHSVRRTIGFIR